MPRKAKGPRIQWRESEAQWVIRDTNYYKRTGSPERSIAERQLAEYISTKWEPEPTTRPSDTVIAVAIRIYAQNKLPNATRPKELEYTLTRLNDFWGNKKINEIVGATCRQYTKQSNTDSVARRDLEILRASINMYAKEYGLDYTPKFTLPDKEQPRTGWMTRQMAARMLIQAHRQGNRHLVRYLLIGLYTGTRSSAILNLQWFPNTTGGFVDLERSVLHRSAPEERKTKKRKPPAAIPRRLEFWLKRWQKQDTAGNARIPYVVHYQGKKILSLKRVWGRAREASGLSEDITPHIMRHTSITWAMQAGTDVNLVCSYFGVTMETLQRVYWHHHPDFQKDIRNVF